MSDDLVVHLNRDGPQTLAAEPPRFATGGSFDVVLRNHGTPLHVHLHLDDDLSRRAELGTANHFVEAGAVRRVRVTVDEPLDPVEGRLKVVTGYGSHTEYVTVTLAEPEPERRQVRVDESLGQPTRSPAPEPRFDAGDLPLLAVGGVALVVALVAAMLIGGVEAVVGLLIVVVGLVVAVALLRG